MRQEHWALLSASGHRFPYGRKPDTSSWNGKQQAPAPRPGHIDEPMALNPGRFSKHGTASQPVSIRAMTLCLGRETAVAFFLTSKAQRQTLDGQSW